MDYLKYDWLPCDPYNADRMKRELLQSGRDFGFCVTVRAGLEHGLLDQALHLLEKTTPIPPIPGTISKIFFSVGNRGILICHLGHFYDMDMLEEWDRCRITPAP